MIQIFCQRFWFHLDGDQNIGGSDGVPNIIDEGNFATDEDEVEQDEDGQEEDEFGLPENWAGKYF